MPGGGLQQDGLPVEREGVVRKVEERLWLGVSEEEASERGRTAWELCLLLKERGVLAKPTHRNM